MGGADHELLPHGDARHAPSGADIAEGDYVLLLYQSANRDEAVFGPTADQLDVTRAPNPHVSLRLRGALLPRRGAGPARGAVLFEELLARWPGYEVAGSVGAARRAGSRAASGHLRGCVLQAAAGSSTPR